jgi:hypothetical protein
MVDIQVSELKVNDIIIYTDFYKTQTKYIYNRRINNQLYLTNMDGYNTTLFLKPDQIVNKITDNNLIETILKTKRNRTLRQGFKVLSWVGGELGSDPEMFVTDKDNKMIPSFEFLKSKEEKDYTLDPSTTTVGNKMGWRQTIFWDGFQAEFNVYSATCLSWVVDSTFNGMKTLQEKARAYKKGSKVSLQTTFDIDPETLMNAKNEHVAFGCMPSYNIYGAKGLVEDGRNVPFRSAGGHIHFGIKDIIGNTEKTYDKERIERYVKALDAILGVACVSLFERYDDPRRRSMYGLAGEYRLPPHGLEYRVLSNAWLCHPLIMNIVFELARKSIAVGENELLELWDSTEEETVNCINNCDVSLAREILARNKTNFTDIINTFTGDASKSLNIYKIFMNGVHSIIENPDDIEKNWGLNGKFEGHCEGDGMTIKKMTSLPKYKDLVNDTTTEIYEEMVAEIKAIEETAIPNKRTGTF